MPVIETSIGRIDTVSWGDGSADLLLFLHASCTGPRAYTGLAERLAAPARHIVAPDFPELTTFGDTREEALSYTVSALEKAIAARIASRDDIPSPGGRGGMVGEDGTE